MSYLTLWFFPVYTTIARLTYCELLNPHFSAIELIGIVIVFISLEFPEQVKGC